MQHDHSLLIISVLLTILIRTSTAINQIDYGHPLYELQLGQPADKEIYHLQRDVVEGVANIQPPPPPDVSSLTFVFDATGSMNDDLNQVRHGAKGIFETVMKQRKKLIYNFILVLFHDPGRLIIFLFLNNF
uniref:Hemicentin-1-like von Willebrand factor A domain-containing protein n=1 Tax=Meloidogyne enterolobii TaxID=390850 RepID=A0A6V7W551_MELEN|nr:unnamed protein product [Meloidogyne enterolobii]